jgi:hypothetical protein
MVGRSRALAATFADRVTLPSPFTVGWQHGVVPFVGSEHGVV